MITNQNMKMLERLSKGVLAAPILSDDEIKQVQRLVEIGLARDYSSFAGHRCPLRLRIWGINDQGRAVMEQKNITTPAKSRQFTLTHQTHQTHQTQKGD
jgi:hypothetical protein